MFTGIIKFFGKTVDIQKNGDNLSLFVDSDLTPQLSIDQSVSHDGVCLTVVSIKGSVYKVDVVDETLKRTTISNWKKGKLINLETSISAKALLDGHIVQGHVDATATCIDIDKKEGSWLYRFGLNKDTDMIMVEKGSICINGVSLTCFDLDLKENCFSVEIIPYTYESTNFHQLIEAHKVNIEFDVIGKYIWQWKDRIKGFL